MSDAHGGGGGGDGKFFFGIIVGLLVLWVFGLYRNGDVSLPGSGTGAQQSAAVQESTPQVPTTPQPTIAVPVSPKPTPTYHYEYEYEEYDYDDEPEVIAPPPYLYPPETEHGVTYYLDADGNIVDVLRY